MPGAGVLEDLERAWRRVRKISLAAPLLLVVGFGTGNLTKRALSLPEGVTARTARNGTPRIQLDALSERMEELRNDGVSTAEYVKVYNEHVAPVEKVLRRRGVSRTMARNMAWPLVEHAYAQNLDPATVLSIVLVESNAKPKATSSVGARGLMQVMPSWAGHWRGCGRDLYEIEDNLCNGTRILAWYFQRHDGNVRRALLGYNGCVTGSNTPNCHTYPDKVERMRRQIALELSMARKGARVGGAAAP